MKSISLFVDKHSFLNGLSPKTKLAYVVCAIGVPGLVGGYAIGVLFIALSVLLLACSKVIAKTKIVLQVTGFIIVTIFVVQTFFRSGTYTPLFALGPLVARKEGFEFAMKIVLNIFNISFAFCVLTLTTKPSDMLQELVEAGFSPKFGYVFVSLFQIIPQITEHTSVVLDAQRSRGLRTTGSLVTRFKAFVPLISPIMISSFMSARERAIALDVRGFSCTNKKTFITPFVPSVFDTACFAACCVVFAAAVLLALLKCAGIVGWMPW